MSRHVTYLCASLVIRVLGHPPISIHGGEVDCAVQATGQGRDINVKRELSVEGLEQFVGRVGIHQIDTRSNIGLSAGGDKVELDGGAAGSDAVSPGVVSAIKSTVRSAGSTTGADGGVLVS